MYEKIDLKWLPVLDDPALGLLVNPVDPSQAFLAWVEGGGWDSIFINEKSRLFELPDGDIFLAVPYTSDVHEKIIRLRDALTDLPYRHPRLTQLILELP